MAGMTTDPIADMLTRIRNAMTARHDMVAVPASRVKTDIARILKAEGFIADYEVDKKVPATIRIRLRYGDRKQAIITGLRRVSRPGLRVYSRRAEIPRVQGGLGIAIVSTSRGIMTGREARRTGVGGEVLCYIW
jgi:small subunit ribosomal protein S8